MSSWLSELGTSAGKQNQDDEKKIIVRRAYKPYHILQRNVNNEISTRTSSTNAKGLHTNGENETSETFI